MSDYPEYLSAHARVRCHQRAISPSDVEIVERYGRGVHQRGAYMSILGKKELRRAQLQEGRDLSKLKGVHLVWDATERTVMTVYKNEKFTISNANRLRTRSAGYGGNTKRRDV